MSKIINQMSYNDKRLERLFKKCDKCLEKKKCYKCKTNLKIRRIMDKQKQLKKLQSNS
jgi:hypothetical protein